MMPEITKICSEKECQKPFILTSSDRDFFQKKGLIEPKRCKPCREKRKIEKTSELKAGLKEAIDLKGGMIHPLGGEHNSQNN